MTVSFIGTEISNFNSTNGLETTTGGTFRSPQSRSAIQLIGNRTVYAEWGSAVAEGWIHFQMQGGSDNDGSDLHLVVTTSSGGNLFRLVTGNVQQFTPQYWNGSSWVSGTAISNNGSLREVVINLVAGASGSYVIYVDGSFIGGESAAFSGTDMKRATFYSSDVEDSLPTYTRFSEIILGDDDNGLVNSTVETEAPTADATDTDGTGTYADIDEASFSDTDNLIFSAAGERHSFTSPARANTQDSVLGVSVGARMKCDVTGPQGAKFYLKIGGTRYYSDDFTLTNDYQGYQYTWAVNPSTAAAWAAADAEAAGLEWGIETIA